MEGDLRSLLVNDAALAALIGGRVHWGELPQGGALPAIVLNVASEVVSYTTRNPVALRATRVQADVYAETATGAVTARQAMDTAVSGFSGVQGATDFQGIFLDIQRSGTEQAGAGSARVHRAQRDLMVNHIPTVF